ncbi:MAG: ABC-2 transporter permease [Oscillospiraceae bacterium]|nr:ABC-2 transporter permease [Oscillospiraceae bacterium]
MKGLILKDLYCTRFLAICMLLLMLLPNLLLMLAGGGMFVSEEVNGIMMDISGVMMHGLMNFVNIAVCSSVALSVASIDQNCGWDRFQRATPVTAGQIVLSRLISTCIIVGGFTLYAIALNLLSGSLFGLNTELLIAIPLSIGFFEVAVISPVYPLSLKLGIKIANYIHLGMMMLGMALIIGIATLALTSSVPFLMMRLFAYAGLPLLAAASGFASYKAGKKLLPNIEE